MLVKYHNRMASCVDPDEMAHYLIMSYTLYTVSGLVCRVERVKEENGYTFAEINCFVFLLKRVPS